MKNWNEDEWDNLERVQKLRRKKVSRKFTHKDHRADDFEKPESEWESILKETDFFIGRVVEVHKRYAFLSRESIKGQIDTSDVWLGTVAKRLLLADRKERNFLSVGDRVLARPEGWGSEVKKKDGNGLEGQENDLDGDDDDDEDMAVAELPKCSIEFRAPRATRIVRRDPIRHEREHVLAVNMDQLLVVSSFLYPLVKWGLIDRYLVLAELENLPAVIVINKLDLFENEKPEFRESCNAQIAEYEKLGYSVISTQLNKSPKTTPNFDKLRELLKDKISLLSGHSGVGKSSLINLMKPEIEQDVETEHILTKGRHTTSYASFIGLGAGGYVIDTPGIRSFVLEDLDPLSLASGFREIVKYRENCQYRECTHNLEIDCAVKKAVENGGISKRRYQSYLGLLLKTTGRAGRIET